MSNPRVYPFAVYNQPSLLFVKSLFHTHKHMLAICLVATKGEMYDRMSTTILLLFANPFTLNEWSATLTIMLQNWSSEVVLPNMLNHYLLTAAAMCFS